jgi:hypothetical protein
MASVSTSRDSFTPDLGPPEGQKPHETPRIIKPGQTVRVFSPVYDHQGKLVDVASQEVVGLRFEDMSVAPYSLGSVARTPHVVRGRYRVQHWCARKWKKVWSYLDKPGAAMLQLGIVRLETHTLEELILDAFSQESDCLSQLAMTCQEIMRCGVKVEQMTCGVFTIPGTEGPFAEWDDGDVITLA